MLGQENLQGRRSGTLNIGSIVQSDPRKYEVTCESCGSSWNELHSWIQAQFTSRRTLVCRNAPCRLGIMGAETYGQQAHANLKQREREAAELTEYKRLRSIYGGQL